MAKWEKYVDVLAVPVLLLGSKTDILRLENPLHLTLGSLVNSVSVQVCMCVRVCVFISLNNCSLQS